MQNRSKTLASIRTLTHTPYILSHIYTPTNTHSPTYVQTLRRKSRTHTLHLYGPTLRSWLLCSPGQTESSSPFTIHICLIRWVILEVLLLRLLKVMILFIVLPYILAIWDLKLKLFVNDTWKRVWSKVGFRSVVQLLLPAATGSNLLLCVFQDTCCLNSSLRFRSGLIWQ